ncbi:P22AR C-terminal domain-containing protein [Mannheimia indoligenes]|uniref:P22AR C-terminal domain-containing protein n=1 Tax=Mannheimia indoligenes TaxID=3103145 RepID=UPI002FE56BF2
MSNQLTFQSIALTAISRNNQTYISASDLARALQYADASSIVRIFSRNEDEFTADMSDTVKLTVSGNLETTSRIFSLRGCHLIAMFARTPVAKEFRKWVLDILDKEVLPNSAEKRPLVEPSFTHTLTSEELRDLVWLWFGASKMAETMGTLYQPLTTLGSNLAPVVYSQGVEYGRQIQQVGSLIYRLTYGVDFSHNPIPFRHLQGIANQLPQTTKF